MTIRRRTILSRLPRDTLALMALLNARPGFAQSAPTQLSLGTYGGVFETALNTLAPKLKADTGIELVKSIGSSQIILSKLQAGGQHPPFEAVIMTAEAMLLGEQRNFLRPVTVEQVPGLARVQKRLLAPFATKGGYTTVPTHWKAIGILWRHDLVPFEIRSWLDLWRPELRNRISVQNMPTLGGALMLVSAAIVHGGSQRNLEPGWQAMRALRPNIREFYAITSNALTSLVAGDTWVSVNTLDLGLPLASRNVVATAPVEGVGYSPEGIGFPRFGGNEAAAYRFADFMLRDDVQLAWAQQAKVAPSTTVAVPPGLQQDLVETEAMLSRLFDIDFLNIALDIQKWSDRWREEVVG